LIVVEETSLLAGRDEIEVVVTLTVLLSVLLHGVTAAPISAAYARRVERIAPEVPEKRDAVEVPSSIGPAAATRPEKSDGVQ